MFNRLWLSLRSVVFRRRLEREMRDEMAEHLDRSVERLMAQGMAREEAEREARREFGNLEVVREEARDARGGRGLESLAADLRCGARQFLRQPLATLTIVLVLALGIGLNTALFVLISSIVSGDLPGVTEDPALVRIRGGERTVSRGFTIGREFSYPEYRGYASETGTFSAVAAWTSSDATLDVGRPDVNEEHLVSGAATYVTSDYFRVLDVRMATGAGLPLDMPDDGEPHLAAVISHVVWERFYDRANDVVGRTMKVNGVPMTIAGVAARRFNGARTGGSQVRVWLPLSARPLVQRSPPTAQLGYDAAIFGLVARLQPGVNASDALPIADSITARAVHEVPALAERSALSADVVTLRAENYFPPSGLDDGPRRPPVMFLMPFLPPVLILAITGTTVSALQAGLAIARRREMAVRLALGASRRRLVRHLVTETVVLALVAGALGLFVIWVLIRVFESVLPDVLMKIDWRSLSFTSAIALVTGVLFGLSPALHATRLGVSEVLKDAAAAFVPSRSRLQAGLVVAQIALSQPALLLMGAVFLEMVHGFRQMPGAARGERILEARFNINPRYGAIDDRREQTLARLRARLETLPGVVAVVPQESGGDEYVELSVHSSDREPGVVPPSSGDMRAVAAPAGYFALMSMPIMLGRDFERAGPDVDGEIVVGATLARQLWGDANPIGRRLTGAVRSQRRAGAFTVVGVVDDSAAGEVRRIYVPSVGLTGYFLIGTDAPAESMAARIRSAATGEAPELPLVSLRTLAAIEESERRTFLRGITAAGVAGVVALLLSAIGLYAVVAFAVSQRVREIGIRTALGADHSRILAMFLRRGVSLSVAGVVIGLALSLVGGRVFAALSGEEAPSGTAVIGAVVAVVVTGVALLATWIPARRATRVDPLAALRME